MKKVLILAAALALAAVPAFAATSIVGSKHDMRDGQPGGDSSFVLTTSTTTQVCVFCHTPHGAAATGPLWNRSKNVSVAAAYNSATLDQTNSRPTVVTSKVAASDAKLCISCHDGANVVSGLLNPPNDDPTVTFGSATGFGTGVLSIGTLGNDHPIGMNYSAVAAADANGFNATPLGTGITFYDGGVMWCSSCHDVHDKTNVPFLVQSVAGSQLCVSCHKK